MGGYPLETLANVAEIVGATTIIIGLLFGWAQIREHRNHRRDLVAVDLMKSFYGQDFARAIHTIRSLPDGVSADDLRERGAHVEECAVVVAMTFETMGLLVFQRVAPFSLVRELAGGMVVVMWTKLSSWADTIREEQSQPSWAEWFQWLAEQVSDGSPQEEPAYVQFRNWRP